MGATPDKFAARNVTYHFGLFVLDPATGTLTRNGVRVKLQDQPFQLLVLLLEQSGQIVSREEIQRRLWPGNTFVEFDKSLGVAVLKVREALRDEASNPLTPFRGQKNTLGIHTLRMAPASASIQMPAFIKI